MYKTEMIEVLAALSVPPGVQIFAEHLTEATRHFSESPNPALLERLHQSSLGYYQDIIDSTIIEAVEEEAKAEHRRVVEKLREFAANLGIKYNEPEDNLL